MGGPFNRWLNISQIEVIGGAEDPDSKIFMCEVCVARGTPFEECHTANYTNFVTGGPPNITEGRSKNLRICMYEMKLSNMRPKLCMLKFIIYYTGTF